MDPSDAEVEAALRAAPAGAWHALAAAVEAVATAGPPAAWARGRRTAAARLARLIRVTRVGSDSARARRGRRDRRGRGLRGPLAPPHLPLSRTPAERFDDLVLDAVEHLEEQWAAEIEDLEFAVEDVPPPDAIVDDVVPLSRTVPATPGHPARIVVFRRPVEARAVDPADLADLVLDVVVTEVARELGIDPDVLDPPDED